MSKQRPLLSIALAQIAIPDKRIGFYDPMHAERLGSDMAAHGQQSPVHVRRNGNAAKLPWSLVAGLHRYRGAETVGLETLDALQVADCSASALEIRRLELSENLDHRHRRPIERAIFMVERARIEEAIDHPGRVGETPQARAGRARQSASATMADADGWRERTAYAMGCSLRSLERYQQLYTNIVEALPEHAEALNFHPFGESLRAMTELAKQPLAARRAAAAMILTRTDWRNIPEAFVAAGIEGSTGQRVPDHQARAAHHWKRMSLNEQRAHIEWLAENITPGMADELVGQLKANGRLP